MEPPKTSSEPEGCLTIEGVAGLRKLFLKSASASRGTEVSKYETPNLYIWIHNNEEDDLTKNPIISMHKVSFTENTTKVPYVSDEMCLQKEGFNKKKIKEQQWH